MSRLCLVTGATGYVGGRLVPRLLDAGFRVRVLARHPERVRDRPWAADVEVVVGDAADPDSVRQALNGVDVGYYLLHSLQEGAELESEESRLATIFAEAAHAEHVKRLVYLGGLAPAIPLSSMSRHMRSRAQVGEILRASGVPTCEFRAAVVMAPGQHRLRCCATSPNDFPQ